jgi:hypothetical protein
MINRLTLPLLCIVILAGCGGSATQGRFNERTLLSESAAALHAHPSARLRIVVTARILHSVPLPHGTDQGPYTLTVSGAYADEARPVFDLDLSVREPGSVVSIRVLSDGQTLYVRPPGVQWYSLALAAPGTGSASRPGLGSFLEQGARRWMINVTASRAGSADVLAGDVDMGAFTHDLDRLAVRLHLPKSEAGLFEYLASTVDDPAWRLTFGHATHLLEGVHAIDEIDFNSVERRELHQPMPFGLPYQIDGVSLVVGAHFSDWGVHVRATPPRHAKPLAIPDASAVANHPSPAAAARHRRLPSTA